MGEYRKERLLLKGQVRLIIDPMDFRMDQRVRFVRCGDGRRDHTSVPFL